jgi:protein phosphatase PTC6
VCWLSSLSTGRKLKETFAGEEWSFLVLLTDGITGAISDQEIVDICRQHLEPAKAADAVVSFAEEVGA